MRLTLVAAVFAVLYAQDSKPKPAFSGQTGAPAPAKPSPPFEVTTITTRLTSPWSFAFYLTAMSWSRKASAACESSAPTASCSPPSLEFLA